MLNVKSLFIFFLILFSIKGFSQVDSTTPPFLKYPTLPPIQLLMGDSVTKYTKDHIPKRKPVLVMLFSPDCSHCQHSAEEMVKYKDDLKDIHIVMATTLSLTKMNAFMEKYGLSAFDNIVAGRDIYYLLPSFYNIHNLPYMAFYNRKGDLIKGFEGAMPIKKVIQTFKEK
jgi:thioredoxin-related protein